MGLLNILGITKAEKKLESGYHYLNAALELMEEDNMEKAYDYLIIAAEKGYDSAYTHIGWMCLTGTYVEKDLEMAEECFIKAANADSHEAYYWLAVMILAGDSSVADDDAAIEMLHYAAQENVDAAQLWLAEMYFSGDEFLEQDYELSKFYTQRAAINGNQDAIDLYNANKGVFNNIPDIKVEKKKSRWSNARGLIQATNEAKVEAKTEANKAPSIDRERREDKLIWGRKCCGTCEHWQGKRSLVDNNTNVVIETYKFETKGRCMQPKFNNMKVDKPHNQFCNEYYKWTVIR